jgi:2-desacetyl-2-hydroxyethyl bacteriochlorophyllide A dehydrogenase
VNRTSLYFTGPGKVELREEAVPEPGNGEVLVRALFSAISSGTELLVYHDDFPSDLPVDATIPSLAGTFGFPLKYGYSVVGQVVALGSGVDVSWLNRSVFAFHPHESLFAASPDELVLVPDNISLEDAVLLPGMETAVNFLMDGRPLIGERVVVFGQGIIGLLTTSLLAQFPLGSLTTVDRYPLRRRVSLEAGATASLDPEAPDFLERVKGPLYGHEGRPGPDLTFELSGNPDALNQAITVTCFDGRIILGSWYGRKQVALDLGGRFHRSRIKLISSQVSSLAPVFSGRWTRARRFETAWRLLDKVKPSRFINRRFHIAQAAEAYRSLDSSPDEVIQVILTY